MVVYSFAGIYVVLILHELDFFTSFVF